MEYLCHKWPRICSTCHKHFPVLLWQSYVPILLQETCSFVTIVCSNSITRNVFLCDNRMFPFYYKKRVHLWQSYVPILLQETCSFVTIVCSHSITRNVFICDNRMFPFYYKKRLGSCVVCCSLIYILITPLASSNSSCNRMGTYDCHKGTRFL
jgi:hypothetical protein